MLGPRTNACRKSRIVYKNKKKKRKGRKKNIKQQARKTKRIRN